MKPYQTKYLSSAKVIQKALKNDRCMGFYAIENNTRISFALVKKFDEDSYFLWNFLIDSKYQGLGKGKKFLQLLVDELQKSYSTKVITTTYIYGNEVSKNFFKSFGFAETDVVCEDDVHEVNMELIIKKRGVGRL
ncbi:MAG: GNAT family N-acetyltransferase [Defluviitaleaceae bacterium]|nr:GNAT family N-acetyltransferase [Defluviitaleaceae bacterium]